MGKGKGKKLDLNVFKNQSNVQASYKQAKKRAKGENERTEIAVSHQGIKKVVHYCLLGCRSL